MGEFDNLQNRVIVQAWKKKQKQQETRYPVEDPEGVHTSEFPRETPLTDKPGAVSLSEIEVLDLISEGEIDEIVQGEYSFVGTLGRVGYDSATYTPYAIAPGTSARWLRSIYWNQVPVVNSSNQFNFQSVDVAYTVGVPNGSLVGLLNDELMVSRQIGERLRYGVDFAKTYRLLNKDIKAFEVNVRFNALSKTNTSKEEYGDTEETTVQYNIQWRALYSTPGKTPSSYPKTYHIPVRGKITQGYIQNTRVNLISSDTPTYEPDFLGWEIRIYRLTPDATNNSVRNQTYIDSITEIFGDVFTYPNSAIVSARFSAEYFSQVPARAYDARLMKVQVPANYNPILKQYTGDWDGTFKDEKVWSDNPAWCFYDLISNKRYGLGRYISEDQIDKWTLYDIAQYCDTMVPDGEGGVEPRFTCNLLINSREEAYTVVNNMASIFRAMTYYFAGSVYTVQDAYKAPIYQFTNANVVEGDFTYSSSSRRVRHTAAVVRYNNKNDFFRPTVEYVEDFDGIRKYGIRELELTAFGCTSRGQAWRFGRWGLLSETMETESISFAAGLEGAYLRPGDIIQVQDNNRTSQRFGGRVYRIYDDDHLLLDSAITGLQSSQLYFISLLTPSYNYDVSQVEIGTTANSSDIRRSQIQKKTFLGSQVSLVTGSDGAVRTNITFSSPFDTTNYLLTGHPIWTIEGSGVGSFTNQWEYYRVLRVEEQEPNRFGVSAIQFESGKFTAVESGLNFEEAGYGSSVPAGPTNLQLTVLPLSTNTKKIQYTYTVPNTDGITSFKVYVKLGAWTSESELSDNTYLAATLQAHERGSDYYPATNGIYYFRVYSVNRRGARSTTYAAGSIEVAGMVPTNDILIGGLVLLEEETDSTTGGTRKESIATISEPTFKWQLGIATNGLYQTGLYYRFTAREPSVNSVPNSHIYFEQTGLLKNEVENLFYEFSLHDNINTISSRGVRGPFRTYDAVIEGMLEDGTSTAGGNFVLNNDSDYSNANGYDILAVTNPRIESIPLTDGNNFTAQWKTDQWISPEGEIKLKFINASFPEDFAGGYAYYSLESFNRAEALGLVTTNKVINSFHITESGNPFVMDAGLTGVREAYLAVALYDEFDSAIIATGTNVQPQLNWSNVVKLTNRGDATSQYRSSFFAAWTEMYVDMENGSIDGNWATKNYNVGNVDSYFNGSIYVYRVYFANPFTSNNYVVFGYEIDETSNDQYPRIEKYADRFEIYNIIGQRFFGVLYNGDIQI